MKKIKMAVIGAGAMGTLMSETYSHCPQLEITAICDRFDSAAYNAANHLKKATGREVAAYGSYEEMRDNAVYDAVFIACPPDIQVDYACEEMNRGIHVMTQVPAAVTIKQCEMLVDTVRKTGVKYQLAEQTRYWHFFDMWRELADAGKFGKILSVDGQYLHFEPAWDLFVDKETGEKINGSDMSMLKNERYEPSWRYRILSKPLLYLPHTLSPLLSVTGGRIEKVAAFGTRKSGYVYEGYECRDMECAVMYNSNDIIFNVKAGFTTPHPFNNITCAHWYSISGTQCCSELSRGTTDSGKIWTRDGGWRDIEMTCEDPGADEFIRSTSHGGADYWPIHYFVKAICEDTQPPMDVYKAVETAAPAILAAESCELGGETLVVPDFRKRA